MQKTLIVAVLVMIGCVSILVSQTTKSMYGTKFFIAWPFNGGPDTTYCHFSIHALNKTTSGFIKTSDTTIPFTLTSFENSFTYTSINNLNTSKNFYSKYEVKESEVIENKGVYIETKDSVFVVLYTQNYDSSFYQNLTFTDEQFFAENTLVYPIKTFSKSYRVLTKSEDSASSQFLIVATEDSTEIEILPSQNTEKGKPKGVPFTITLHKGQTYLVRSVYDDLTGSKVTSKGPECKTFAVFVGSPSTTIAKTSNPLFQNKNTLFEQLPPTELAGKKYIIERNNSGPNNFYSTIRILALNDSTQIIFDGQYLDGVLSAGHFIDLPTDENIYFYSEKPLLVAQFMRSLPGSNPLMVFRNSIDNRINTILFPSNLGRPPNISSIGRHSLTKIIMRCKDTSSLFLNGSPQQNNGFRDPWEIIGRNPIYCFCNYYNIFDTNALKIESIYGEGIIAINFLVSMISSHAMSGVSSFERTVFGGIDTSGIFTNYSYCQNIESIFEAKVDSTASEIFWEFGDGNKANGKTVFNRYHNAGFYTVKLIIYRKAFCTYDTIRKIIDVKTSPLVKTGSRPIIRLCKGETVQIGRILDPNLTYRWSPSEGLSDSTIAVTTATVFQDTMKYYLRGYDQFGCVGIDSITIEMYKQPIANAGPDTVSCGGNGVQIGRQTSGGTPNYSFLWTPADGLSNDKIERPIAAPSTNTTYILRVTDANGCIAYDTVNIQALPSPTIDAGNPVTICEGDSVQLNATGANQFRWVNARNISDTTIGNPTVYPTVTTTYYVAGLFETGCVAFDSVLVTVTPKPRLPIAFQTTACPNATKTYTVENRGDLTYNWEINGGNLTSGQGTNEVTVTWGAGPTGSIKLTTTTTAGYCSFDTTVNITISSDIKPTITENKKNTVIPSLGTVRICPNESVTLDVGVGYTEITWTNGSTSRQTTVSSEGWIGVQVKDATGCSGGDSVFVDVVPPPTVFAGNDRVLCGADTAVMRGNVNGSGNYRYQWIPPTAVSDPTALVTDFIAPTTTNLIFQAIDTVNGCITSDTVLMTILTLAGDFITTSKPNNVLCFGEQMTLDAGAFDSYLWSTGETSRTITISTGGSYWVDAKSGSCSAIDTIQIVQNPQIVVIPTPDITASPGATVTLDANATGGTLPYQFQWSPNVNFVDPTTVQSPRVTANVGSQSYIVTITDANGCVARDTITVFVPSTATTVAIARREVSATAFGESFPITATLTPNTPITPSGFTATITIPFEQFIPKSVSNGTMTVTQNATDYVININVPITEPIQNGEVITELIGDILLGQQDSTTIVLTSAQWQGTTYPLTTQNGRIVLNDVCYSGTRRYLLPTTVGFGILSVHPNPSNTKATFEFGIIEAGQTTFEIIDVFGNIVHSTSWNRQPTTPKGGTDDNRYTHTVDISNLPSGTYYGVLKSFSQRESVPLVITR